MKNIDISNVFKPIYKLFVRFHMTLFIVLVTAGLATAVIFLNQILVDSGTATNYTSPIDAGSIDQATLERIKELHTSDEPVAPESLPGGRINPFGE